MNLNTKSARAEARAGFRWRGNNGCQYREFTQTQVSKCLKGRNLGWVAAYHPSPPPIIQRDLEVRYDLDLSTMKAPEKEIPAHLPESDVYVIEGASFFKA